MQNWRKLPQNYRQITSLTSLLDFFIFRSVIKLFGHKEYNLLMRIMLFILINTFMSKGSLFKRRYIDDTS